MNETMKRIGKIIEEYAVKNGWVVLEYPEYDELYAYLTYDLELQYELQQLHINGTSDLIDFHETYCLMEVL